MKDITFSAELLTQAIEASLPEIIKENLTSSYKSPISKVVEEELKNQEGVIRELVKTTIVAAISDPSFKERLANLVVARIVEQGLK